MRAVVVAAVVVIAGDAAEVPENVVVTTGVTLVATPGGVHTQLPLLET